MSRVAAARVPGAVLGAPTALAVAALVAILGLGTLVWWIAGGGGDGAVVAGLAVLGPVALVAVYASVFTGSRSR